MTITECIALACSLSFTVKLPGGKGESTFRGGGCPCFIYLTTQRGLRTGPKTKGIAHPTQERGPTGHSSRPYNVSQYSGEHEISEILHHSDSQTVTTAGIRSHHFMANGWGNNGNSERLYFGGSKITADGDCSHEIKRRLLLGRKVMTLDSIFKSRDISLPTKVRLVKAMVFPVVMYGCGSWTVKKADS